MTHDAGRVRLWKVPKGADLATTTPTNDGWEETTNLSNPQDGNHIAVLDNGYIRFVINQGANSGDVALLSYGGSSWTPVLDTEDDYQNQTITAVEENSKNHTIVTYEHEERNSRTSGSEVQTFRAELIRGARTVRLHIVSWNSVGNYYHIFKGSSSTIQSYFTPDFGLIDEDQGNGFTSTPTMTNENWEVIQAQDGHDIVTASTKQNPFVHYVTSGGMSIGIRTANQVEATDFWIGHIPRDYQNKGTNISSATKREAEDEDNNSGTWSTVSEPDASNDEYIQNDSANDSDNINYTVHVPTPGKWAVAARGRINSSGQGMDATLDGETKNNTLPTTSWSNNPSYTIYTDFVVEQAGDKTLTIGPDGAHTVEVDAIILVPLESTEDSPNKYEFPRNIGHSVASKDIKFLG